MVSEWDSKAKLEFFIQNTEAMVLKSEFRRERRPRFKLQARPMWVPDSVKYVGSSGKKKCTVSGM